MGASIVERTVAVAASDGSDGGGTPGFGVAGAVAALPLGRRRE